MASFIGTTLTAATKIIKLGTRGTNVTVTGLDEFMDIIGDNWSFAQRAYNDTVMRNASREVGQEEWQRLRSVISLDEKQLERI